MKPQKLLRLQVLFAISLASVVSAEAADLQIDWPTGADLGFGFDARSGDIKPRKCINLKNISPKDVGKTAGDGFSAEFARSKDELRTKLTASAGGSYSSGFTKASGRASMAKTISISDEEIVAIVRDRVTLTESGTEEDFPRFNTDYAEQQINTPRQFLEECGTHYVAVLLEGGELVGLVKGATKTEGERQSFTRAVKASGTGVSGELQLAQSLEKYKSTSEITVRGYKAGGTHATPDSIESLQTEFADFRKGVSQRPVTIAAIVRPYPALPPEVNVALFDDAAKKAFAYEDKKATLEEVMRDSARYDLDPASYDAFRDHIVRVHARSVEIWNDIEACHLSTMSSAGAQSAIAGEPACQRLLGYKYPPFDKDDSDIPRKFVAGCTAKELYVDEWTFEGFNRQSGDYGIAPLSGEFQFEGSATPSNNGRQILIDLTVSFEERFGLSKDPGQRELHAQRSSRAVPLKGPDGKELVGCRLASSLDYLRIQKGPLWKNYPYSKVRSSEEFLIRGDLLEKASCRFQEQGIVRKSAAVCTVTFRRFSNVQLVPEELAGAAGIQQRSVFTKSKWLP